MSYQQYTCSKCFNVFSSGGGWHPTMCTLCQIAERQEEKAFKRESERFAHVAHVPYTPFQTCALLWIPAILASLALYTAGVLTEIWIIQMLGNIGLKITLLPLYLIFCGSIVFNDLVMGGDFSGVMSISKWYWSI